MSDQNALPAGFGEVDPDFQRQAYAEAKKEGGGSRSDVLFLKSGITHCRFLPPHEDAPSWFRALKEHGLRIDGKYQTYTCPRSEADDDSCPICERGKELYQETTEESIKAAKRLNAKPAYLYNAYVYSSPDAKTLKDGIFVLKSGVKVFKQLMDYDNDPAGDWGNISNLTSGLDFRIERKGKGRFGTEYVVMAVPTRSNILDKLEAAGVTIGVPVDLTGVYPAKSYEELEFALGADEGEEND